MPTTRECVHTVSKRDRYDVCNFASSCLHAAPGCRNALAVWAVVFMHLLMRRGWKDNSGRFSACVTVIFTRWPSYTNLARIHQRYTGCANVNFVCQGFRKLSTVWQTYRPHTEPRCTERQRPGSPVAGDQLMLHDVWHVVSVILPKQVQAWWLQWGDFVVLQPLTDLHIRADVVYHYTDSVRSDHIT